MRMILRSYPVLFLLFVLGFYGPACLAQGDKISLRLSPDSFRQQVANHLDGQLIDVRTPEEFAKGHLKNARNININDGSFATEIARLEKDKPVFVYCLGGGRSANAAEKMQRLGFNTIYDLKGGILAWEGKGFPIANTPSNPQADKFTKPSFDSLLAKHPKLMIDFYAPWCAPCKKMEPYLHTLQAEYADRIGIVRLNIDEAKSLALQLRVDALPVVAIYRQGKEIERVDGLQSEEQLRALLEKL